MSDANRPGPRESGREEESDRHGPSLTLIYSLIVLAMLAAIVVAAMIVLPFYHRR